MIQTFVFLTEVSFSDLLDCKYKKWRREKSYQLGSYAFEEHEWISHQWEGALLGGAMGATSFPGSSLFHPGNEVTMRAVLPGQREPASECPGYLTIVPSSYVNESTLSK